MIFKKLYLAKITIICPFDSNLCQDLSFYVFATSIKNATNKIKNKYKINNNQIQYIVKTDFIADEVCWKTIPHMNSVNDIVNSIFKSISDNGNDMDIDRT